IYPVHTPAVARLLDEVNATGPARPALPRALDWWEPAARELAELLRADQPAALNGQHAAELAELEHLLVKLDRKMAEFDAALAEEPRTIDRARAEYLEMLALYAQQLAARMAEALRDGALAGSLHPGLAAAHRRLLELVTALAAKAEERTRHTWAQR